MTVFDRLLPLLVAGIFLLAVAVPLALFLVSRKLARIERALWAIRSELELARPAAQSIPRALARETDTAGAPTRARVVSSMFGR